MIPASQIFDEIFLYLNGETFIFHDDFEPFKNKIQNLPNVTHFPIFIKLYYEFEEDLFIFSGTESGFLDWGCV